MSNGPHEHINITLSGRTRPAARFIFLTSNQRSGIQSQSSVFVVVVASARRHWLFASSHCTNLRRLPHYNDSTTSVLFPRKLSENTEATTSTDKLADSTVPKVETDTNADATQVNTSVVNSVQEKGGETEEPVQGPPAPLTGRKLALAHLGFLLHVCHRPERFIFSYTLHSAIFCVALDQTIVSTALPKLASQFNTLDELTWIVSAYLLTQAGLMMFFGQVLTINSSKWVYGPLLDQSRRPTSL